MSNSSDKPGREHTAKIYVPLVTGDLWLTCNQCKHVCADRHELYDHKRAHTGTAAPEPRSLIQSTLRQG